MSGTVLAFTVVTKGRPRKAGERHPGGKLKVERRARGDPRSMGMYYRARDSFDKRYAVMFGEIGRRERLDLISMACAETLTWTSLR